MQLCRPYIYLLSAAGALVLVGLHYFTRVEIDGSYWQSDLMFAFQLALLLVLWVRLGKKLVGASVVILRGHKIAQGVVEGLMMFASIATVLRLLDHATKTFAVPLADEPLARADVMLGLPWLAYFEWVHDHPTLHPAMQWAYYWSDLAVLGIILGLALVRQQTRMKAFIEAFVICSLVSIAIGAFFPARAAVDYLIGDVSAYTNFDHVPGVYHLKALEELRAPFGAILIGDGHLAGMTTFPSLHTAIGVLVVLASLGTRLWVPALAFAVVMIPATPVWGGHYFVDLIGGAAVAVVIWVLVCRSLSIPAFGGWRLRRHVAAPIPSEA
ncbi:MAG: hypothetical protein CR993_06640 [Rhodobacterales bacterium]|nr:MAG: hypothetical protein CR993_06640 [Rhodobacterales bacterium]